MPVHVPHFQLVKEDTRKQWKCIDVDGPLLCPAGNGFYTRNKSVTKQRARGGG